MIKKIKFAQSFFYKNFLITFFLLFFSFFINATAVVLQLDSTFNPTQNATADLRTTLLQSDGKIISAGRSITRLNADGTLDSSFQNNPNLGGKIAWSLALQNNGKIIVAGNFNSFNGAPVKNIIRLNSDGSFDSTFTAEYSSISPFITQVAVFNDKIIAVNLQDVFRLNSNGSLDTTFSNSTLNLTQKNSVVVQSDGSIIIGASDGIYKLNNTGKAINSYSSQGGKVFLQSNDDVLVAPSLNGQSFIRLKGNNLTKDPNFNTTLTGGTVISIAEQSNGQLVVGGSFTSINNQARNFLARLNQDGSLDDTFDPGVGPSNFVNSTHVQPDKKIIIAGLFSKYNGVSMGRIARLLDSSYVEPIDLTLSADPNFIATGSNSKLTWTVANATSCTASGGWSGTKNINGGNENVNNITKTTKFILTCSNSSGESITKEVSVFVMSSPTVTLSASPANVVFNGSTYLTWTAKDAETCVATSSPTTTWAGIKNTNWNGFTSNSSGSQPVSNIKVKTVFTLTCRGGLGDEVSKSVIVDINPSAPSVNLSATPTNVAAGGSTNLTWTVANATSCTASGGWSGTKAVSGGTEPKTNITTNTTYTLTCTGPGGTSPASVSVNVLPLPIVSLTASPTNVTSGGATTLTWTTQNATSCTASGGWIGTKAVSGGTQIIGNITANMTYTLTCTNQVGSTPSSVNITVNPSAPSVNLSATPTNVAAGGSTNLTWTVANATSCTASGGWSGTKAVSGGTEPKTNITTNTTYTLTCTGPGGTSPASVSVNVLPLPIVSLTASPTNVTSGGATTLTWTTQNATSCTASGGWSGTKAVSGGTEPKTNITTNTTYTLTCTGPGGNNSSSVIVTTTPLPVPTVTLTSNISSTTPNTPFTLTWVVKDAAACTASNDGGISNWTGNQTSTNGTHTKNISGISKTTSFTLSCSNSTGVTNSQVIVSLISEKLIFRNSKVLNNETVLSWTATNLRNCTASTKNPTSGLNWAGSKISTPSPYTGSTPNVKVTAVDTTDNALKNEFILTCYGQHSNKEVSQSLFLDENDGASSGTKIPDYQEN